jgi:hypothetical protein
LTRSDPVLCFLFWQLQSALLKRRSNKPPPTYYIIKSTVNKGVNDLFNFEIIQFMLAGVCPFSFLLGTLIIVFAVGLLFVGETEFG